MCGIAGFWGLNVDLGIAEHMLGQLAHRGPNEKGLWVNQTNDLVLLHRRLSIVDLSPAGQQPMVSACGRYVIVFNGEIYNHMEIREVLRAEGLEVKWKGLSDTETLLVGLAHWGVHRCLKQIVGMFAFALWDNKTTELCLARDRIGEKPLYYGRQGGVFLFGSELKALRVHPEFRNQIDRQSLGLFLQFNNVPAPHSIYEDIFKLQPGHYITVSKCGGVISDPVCYWSIAEIATKTGKQSFKTSGDLINQLDSILLQSIKLQMQADVPLGVFLSGGIDSTAIAALTQSQSHGPIKTFSLGFHESDFDEAKYARLIAESIGSQHMELYIHPSDAVAVIPNLPKIYDEPFADVSQIPTYLVSRLAAEHVVVCLSGDGGDELFCGYNRYLSGYQAWTKVRPLPVFAKQLLKFLLSSLSTKRVNSCFTLMPGSILSSVFFERLVKMAKVVHCHDIGAFYKSVISQNENLSTLMVKKDQSHLPPFELDFHQSLDPREQMMLWDMASYLPDDVLTKIDRASMATSLETRVPFLDHRIVEFAWSVPMKFKYRDGQGKWLLRQLLNRYVPSHLLARPKMGFSVPISDWLRGPLRDWGETMLDANLIRSQGYLNPEPVRKMWTEHQERTHDWQHQLWNILMFQSWLETQKETR